MAQYSSYYLYQKYEKRGSQGWVPCYPNTYSISGDSSIPMPLVEKSSADPACGYDNTKYRWVNMDSATTWVCEGTTKYYKQKKQVSYDDGATWSDVVPPTYQRGSLIESGSTDCGQPIYQWNLVSGYLCDDCENDKVRAGVSSNTYSVECSSSTTLTSADVSSMTAKTAIEWATIGNCVETIGANAFSGCSALQFARIPNSVTSIGDKAFMGCSAMTECSLPSGIQSIGASAFTNSISLAFINLPNGVTSLGDSSFRNCLNFRYINIPDSLTTIPSYCFYNCDGLTDIELHDGITSIGDYAFTNCDSISTMTLYSETPPTIGSHTLSGTSSAMTIYVPCESVNDYKEATNWSTYANNISGFSSCGDAQYRRTSGTPYCNGVNKYVDVYTQKSEDSGTTWITIKTEQVLVEADSIDCGFVFNGKWKATYVGGTTSSAECNSSSAITKNEIVKTDLIGFYVGNCVTSIGNETFSGCSSLSSCTIGSGVTSIGYSAFRNCSGITSVNVPNSVTSIGFSAFENCFNLTSINIPSGLTSIASQTYFQCSGLTSIVIPDSVTSIGNNAFAQCKSISSCTIGNSVSSIGNYAFNALLGLTSINIPSGVTSIGDGAFAACKNLTSITCLATTPPALGDFVFGNTNDCPIYVPSGSVNTYKSATGWDDYTNRITAIPNS